MKPVPPQEGKFTLDQLRDDECHSFLIPEYDTPGATKRYINKRKPKLFRHILFSWYEDPNQFPEDISRKTFDEWFDLSYSPLVEDLADSNVRKKDFYN